MERNYTLKINKKEKIIPEFSYGFLAIFKTSYANYFGQLQEGQDYKPWNAEDQSPLQQQNFLKNIN